MKSDSAAKRPWVPDVNSGQCYQQQDDDSWRPCACRPGKPCASYTRGGDPVTGKVPE